MTDTVATFDPALRGDLDRMRDALGDTSTDAPLASDFTYMSLLADYGQVWKLAAAAMARRFAAQATPRMNAFSKAGSVSLNWGDRPKSWLAIAAALEASHAADTVQTSGAGALTFTAPERADMDIDDSEYSNGLKGWR